MRRISLVTVLAAGALGLLPSSAFAVAGDFFQPSTSPEAAGKQGLDIASADFNDDNNADLAVANANTPSITILLGNGMGDFTAATPVGTNTQSPWGIVAADLDNDDDIDIATANHGDFGLLDDTVSIFLNDGSGAFAAPLVEATNGQVNRSIDAGHFNSDDDIDLVVGHFQSVEVGLLLNDGDEDGDFTAQAALDADDGVANNLTDVLAAPIDNDPDLDVLIARPYTGTVRTVSNTDGEGALAFQGTAVSVGANNGSTLAVGQFGSNAFNDLAIGNQTANNVRIYTGVGDGNFAEVATSPEALPGTAGNGPNDMAVEDFNGDAIDDLAVAAGFNTANSRVIVLLGNGAGDFTLAPGSPETGGIDIPVGIVADQFNDGNLDLAVSNYFPEPNSLVSILLNDAVTTPPGGGGGSTTPPVTTPVKKKCKKGQKLVKGKCRKKKKKKK